VARLEIPVRTALRFMKGPLPVLPVWQEAESVVIEFEGREFGWVERKRFPHQDEHEPPPGPMVTTLVENGTEEDWDRAAEAAAEPLQRLLSALAFHYNTRIESRRTKGGSGETDLLHPYGAVECQTLRELTWPSTCETTRGTPSRMSCAEARISQPSNRICRRTESAWSWTHTACTTSLDSPCLVDGPTL
jgi:hypothetical protein